MCAGGGGGGRIVDSAVTVCSCDCKLCRDESQHYQVGLITERKQPPVDLSVFHSFGTSHLQHTPQM